MAAVRAELQPTTKYGIPESYHAISEATVRDSEEFPNF
jgi:hypothetical protein